MQAIVSKECTGNGVIPGKDRGSECNFCRELLLKTRGSSNPSTSINMWYSKLRRLEKRYTKTELTEMDVTGAHVLALYKINFSIKNVDYH